VCVNTRGWRLVTACFGFVSCASGPTEAPADARTMTTIVSGAESPRVYSSLAAGFLHTCALDDDGAAWCWGGNDYSQLGAVFATSDCSVLSCSRAPLKVHGGLRFKTLAAGWVHNCGITTDDLTYCWGGGGGGVSMKEGYLGNGILSRSLEPVRVQTDSVFTSIAIGDGHTCALTQSGMAFCWGTNSWGQVGDGSTSNRPVPVGVAPHLRFQRLSAGAYHTCGITTANQAFCWGDNRWGQLGTGDVAYNDRSAAAMEPRRVIGGLTFASIVSGWEHSCAITTTAQTYCWGRNEYAKQLGDDSDVTHRGTPGPIAGRLTFVALSAGPLATCGRTASSESYCWGGNYYGGLGNGEVARAVAHPVSTVGGPFAAIALGQSHTCGLALDRILHCWGDRSAGQF
jgi:alpha-tubulin suppressor-like RCC1 family protein